MYAGVFAVVAFVGWLTTVFVSACLETRGKDFSLRGIVIPTGAMAAVLFLAILTPHWMRGGGAVFTAVSFTGSAAVVCIGSSLLPGYLKNVCALVSAGFASLLAVPFLMEFAKIAYAMWNREVDRGSVRYGVDITLAGNHVVFISLCVAATMALWCRLSKKNALAVWTSGIGATVFAVCINVAFFWTVPRAGNEGVMLWLFLVPGFLLVDLVLLVTCTVVLICSGVRSGTRHQGGDGPPGE